MHELTIELLRKLYRADKVTWTAHLQQRLIVRAIRTADVERCILNGEIIEQYPTDYPYPSCLVLGLDMGDDFLHVVVGSDGETMWIVTAYRPDPEQWESDFKTRKKGNE